MSGRYAVFVDAGYFTAAGQWATSGTYRGRGLYEVDIPAAVSVARGRRSQTNAGQGAVKGLLV